MKIIKLTTNKTIKKFYKNFILIFAPLFLILLLSTYYIYNNKIDAEMNIYNEETKHQLLSQRPIIKDELNLVTSDLLYLGSSQDVIDLFNNRGYINKKFKSEIEHNFLSFCKTSKRYDQIRIIDKWGNETIRINFNKNNPFIVPGNQLQNKKDRYYFNDSIKLKKGQIFISPFDLNIEHSKIEEPHKPILRLATPVYNRSNVKSGILILNFLGNKLINKLSYDEHDLNAKSCLVNKDGYWLKSFSPDKEWGFMIKERKDKSLKKFCPETWNYIIANESGKMLGPRGWFRFDTAYILSDNQVSSTGSSVAFGESKQTIKDKSYFWKIISFIPIAEIEKLKSYWRRFILIIIFTFTILIIFGAWQFSNKNYMKELNLVEREKYILELKESLTKIKTLGGLLPLCANCKKIRTDKGYWQQVDHYISDHTDAEISHSLCPDCAEELYGDQEWFKKSKNKEIKKDED